MRWIAAKGWASLDMLRYVVAPSARFGLVVVVLEVAHMCVVRPRREDPTMYCNSLEPFIGYDGSIAIKAGVHFLV